MAIQNINQEQSNYLNAYKQSLLLWPIDYTEVEVTTSYGQTHIVESGNKDNPPLILLHGASMSSTMWYPNVQKWSEKYRVIAIDIIGDKNKSVIQKEFNNRREHAEWLREVLDALEVEKFDLVGLSFGALNAVNFLLYESERVNKAVLMSPAETFVPFNPSFYSYAFGMVRNEEGVKEFLNWIFNDRYHLHPYIEDQLTAGMMWVDMTRSSKPTKSGFPYVFTDEELTSIKTPVLLLLGDNEVMYNPLEAYERAKKLVPNITAELVEGVGHLMSMEKPDYVSDRALNFLTSEID